MDILGMYLEAGGRRRDVAYTFARDCGRPADGNQRGGVGRGHIYHAGNEILDRTEGDV